VRLAIMLFLLPAMAQLGSTTASEQPA